MSSSSPRQLRCRRTPILAAALALLIPAALAPAASLVRLDFTGTSSYSDSTLGTGTENYAASLTYDPAATPTGPANFPLDSYTGYNFDAMFTFLGGTIKLQDDATVAGFADPVDVITFEESNGFIVFLGVNSITLTTTSDFLTGLQLPTLADFQSALANNKILSATATGGVRAVIPGGGTFDYNASITSISASDASPVPTPAAAIGGLPLLAATLALRSRRHAR
jgi:hypothetical protein